jgi:Tfp pilus assembly protein PilE
MLKKRDQKGFSLVGILVVIVVLATISIPMYMEQSKKNACQTNLVMMNDVIEEYHTMTGSWHNQITEITENTAYFPDGPPKCPDGGTYSINNSTKRVQCSLVASKRNQL